MAQRVTGGRWHRRGVRRMGLSASPQVVVALMVAACVATGAALALHGNRDAVVITRAAESDQDDATSVGGSEVEAPAAPSEVVEAEEGPTRYVVHVDGAVGAPGVVTVELENARVFDAVELAGGLVDDADTSTVNLAEPLSDGAKIHIPHVGEQSEQQVAAAQPGQTETRGATGDGAGQALVNINTASAEELQVLPGVGEATAAAIVDERTRNGPFAAPEDLMRVSGIGEKKFEKVRASICV